MADTRNNLGNPEITVSKWLTMYNSPSSRYGDILQPTFENIRGGFDVEGIGGLEGHFTRGRQTPLPGINPFQMEKLGGSLRLGPLRGSAEIGETTLNPVPLQYRQYFEDPDVDISQRKLGLGVEVPLPFLESSLTGGREYLDQTVNLPHFKGQQERPKVTSPRTRSDYLRWKGKLGDIDFGLKYRRGESRGPLGLQEPYKEIYGDVRIPF